MGVGVGPWKRGRVGEGPRGPGGGWERVLRLQGGGGGRVSRNVAEFAAGPRGPVLRGRGAGTGGVSPGSRDASSGPGAGSKAGPRRPDLGRRAPASSAPPTRGPWVPEARGRPSSGRRTRSSRAAERARAGAGAGARRGRRPQRPTAAPGARSAGQSAAGTMNRSFHKSQTLRFFDCSAVEVKSKVSPPAVRAPANEWAPQGLRDGGPALATTGHRGAPTVRGVRPPRARAQTQSAAAGESGGARDRGTRSRGPRGRDPRRERLFCSTSDRGGVSGATCGCLGSCPWGIGGRRGGPWAAPPRSLRRNLGTRKRSLAAANPLAGRSPRRPRPRLWARPDHGPSRRPRPARPERARTRGAVRVWGTG